MKVNTTPLPHPHPNPAPEKESKGIRDMGLWDNAHTSG